MSYFAFLGRSLSWFVLFLVRCFCFAFVFFPLPFEFLLLPLRVLDLLFLAIAALPRRDFPSRRCPPPLLCPLFVFFVCQSLGPLQTVRLP